MHWLAHWLGLDNASGPVYLGLSGFIGDLSLIGAGFAVYRKHNCHQRWCPRIARHDFTDTATGLQFGLCRSHHPDHPGRKPPAARHIAAMHERNQQGGSDAAQDG